MNGMPWFKRDDYTCVYCGSDADDLHCDHVVSVTRGGKHSMDNLATACSFCNGSKGSKSVDEWRGALGGSR